MALENLQELLVHQLKDIYNAEQQIVKALPKMVKGVENPTLAQALQTHLRETETQVQRLEQVFERLGMPARGKKCKGMEGLLEEGKEVMQEDMDDETRDAALISAAQRVEHYEMAGYGTVRTYAQLMGERDAAKLLQTTLDEEGLTDKKLTQLAESINVEAMDEVEK